MGVSAEAYQELAYAAEMNGVSMSVMEKAAKTLGSTVNDISFDDALQEVLSLSTEEERAAKAAEYFGSAAAY
jgi:hypothetical protein